MMSIGCRQQDNLRALPVQRGGLPDEPYITLTELACCAIYGAPLTAGSDGSLAKLRSARSWTELMLRGPSAGATATEIIFGDEPATIDIPRRIEELAAAVAGTPPDWLVPLMHCFVQAGENIERILEWILIHHDQFEDLEKSLAERSRRFYRLLSHAVAGGQVVLFSMRRFGARVTDPSYKPIDPTNFVGKKVHDLDANALGDSGMPNVSSALGAKIQEPKRLNWFDVKLSLDHAKLLLHEFSSKPEAADIASDPIKVTAASTRTCRKWLGAQMRSSPMRRPKSKMEYYREACGEIEGLGSATNVKPSRAFERAWEGAMSDENCAEVWGRAGASKKSPQ